MKFPDILVLNTSRKTFLALAMLFYLPLFFIRYPDKPAIGYYAVFCFMYLLPTIIAFSCIVHLSKNIAINKKERSSYCLSICVYILYALSFLLLLIMNFNGQNGWLASAVNAFADKFVIFVGNFHPGILTIDKELQAINLEHRSDIIKQFFSIGWFFQAVISLIWVLRLHPYRIRILLLNSNLFNKLILFVMFLLSIIFMFLLLIIFPDINIETQLRGSPDNYEYDNFDLFYTQIFDMTLSIQFFFVFIYCIFK